MWYHEYRWRKLHKIKKDTSEVDIRCFPVMFLGHPIQRKLIQVPLFYLKITINNNKIITINNCSIMTYKVFSLLRISNAPFYILKNIKGKAPDFQMYRVLLYQTILFKTSEQTHIYMLKVYSNFKVNYRPWLIIYSIFRVTCLAYFPTVWFLVDEKNTNRKECVIYSFSL